MARHRLSRGIMRIRPRDVQVLTIESVPPHMPASREHRRCVPAINNKNKRRALLVKVADKSRFRMMVLSPGQLAHPGLAAAAARSGGVGLIDMVHGADASLAQAARNLKTLHAKTAAPQ